MFILLECSSQVVTFYDKNHVIKWWKVLHGFHFLLFKWCIQSDVVVAYSVYAFQESALPWLVKNSFVGILTFSAICTKYPLLRNIKLKSLLLNNFFSNSKLKKNRRILLCCLEHRIWINYKIIDIILLLLASTITSLLLLATTTQVSFTRNYCVSS